VSAPTVSIIIVTHNSVATLGETLACLKVGCGRHTYETIVIDNGSSDGTLPFLSSTEGAQVTALLQNTGFAFASNRGAEKASGEFLLFLNPDVVLDSGAVDQLVEFLSTQPNAGAVVPRMRNRDGTFQPSCRRFPTPFNILFSRGSFLGRHLSRFVYTLPDYDVPTEVPAAAGAAMLMRRTVFAKIGGFDERFFLYMEDTDLCLGLFQRGQKIWYVPSAGGVHGWGRGSSSGKLIRLCRHHVSTWKYFLKHIPNGFTILLLPILLVCNFVASVVALPFRSRS
jgi:GT2 family glycosyltransferase